MNEELFPVKRVNIVPRFTIGKIVTFNQSSIALSGTYVKIDMDIFAILAKVNAI